MKVKNDDCLVFFGDSITEWGRDRENPTSLGTGYVKYVSNYLLDVYHLSNYTIVELVGIIFRI